MEGSRSSLEGEYLHKKPKTLDIGCRPVQLDACARVFAVCADATSLRLRDSCAAGVQQWERGGCRSSTPGPLQTSSLCKQEGSDPGRRAALRNGSLRASGTWSREEIKKKTPLTMITPPRALKGGAVISRCVFAQVVPLLADLNHRSAQRSAAPCCPALLRRRS